MNNFNVMALRQDFPTLQQKVNGKPLVYLDSAATTQRPRQVLAAMEQFDHHANANPHRGAHYLGVQATKYYEGARQTVQKFINARDAKEVIFTKNATEAINMVAYAYGMSSINAGDEILICISEHHSNLVPWQQVAAAKQAHLEYIYLDRDYNIDLNEVKEKITARTKLVSIAAMSNALGTIYPITEIITAAHEHDAVVLIDAAQSIPHYPHDIQELDADFMVFSGHKMLGPMGIGVLYGKAELLERMPPFLTGGDMIEFVEEQTTTYAQLPYKFEAGTPNVTGAIGLAAAIEYLDQVGWGNIHAHEQQLTAYALQELSQIPHLTIYGPQDLEKRGAVISFTIDGCHPHDVASIVDTYGVALRAGHHCAQPLMQYLQVPATSRVSFYLYNTQEEIDVLVASLKTVRKWLGYGS